MKVTKVTLKFFHVTMETPNYVKMLQLDTYKKIQDKRKMKPDKSSVKR